MLKVDLAEIDEFISALDKRSTLSDVQVIRWYHLTKALLALAKEQVAEINRLRVLVTKPNARTSQRVGKKERKKERNG